MSQRARLYKVMITGAFIGVITFIALYGFDVLDVTNVEWLYAKNDLTQHYNGWQFFRNSKWAFPMGLMNTVIHPYWFSVIYTDSIPLFAVFCKMISPVLPASFQYFGIWGLICYLLQGMLSACILNRFTKNKIVLIIGICFFTLSPWMLHRLFMHSSLAAHWLILLCILLCLNSEAMEIKRYVLYWSGVLMLASTIHIYFIPICLVFLGCMTLYRMWGIRKNPRAAIVNLAGAFIPIAAAALMLWLLGAFYGTVQFSKGGLGESSANLNFLFNTVGKSDFFPSLPNPFAKWPEESFGYLGAGVFLLLLVAGLTVIADRKNFIKILQENKVKISFGFLLLFIFLLLSTAPAVTWNTHLLFRWVLPKWLRWLLNVFRSLGRFVWPICYIIMLASIIGVNRIVEVAQKKRQVWLMGVGELILLLCLFLQMSDFKTMYREKIVQISSVTGYESLDEELWDSFIGKYEHIYSFDLQRWYDISTYAASRKLSINQTYLSRMNDRVLIGRLYKTLDELQRGNADSQTLYILPENWDADEWEKLPVLHVYRINDYFVGTSVPLQTMDGYKIQ